MPERARTIEVECQCGQPIARYKKEGNGYLMKMYLDMITVDRAEVFEGKNDVGDNIICPSCNKRIATIEMIHGRPAAKINHGVVKKIQT